MLFDLNILYFGEVTMVLYCSPYDWDIIQEFLIYGKILILQNNNIAYKYNMLNVW